MQIHHSVSSRDVAARSPQRISDDVPSSKQTHSKLTRQPVVIVGAGPVGLAMAIDLAQRNVPVVILDEDDKLSAGSRAICFAKRTLEIFDRLGCGDRMIAKGVSWNVGRVFLKEEQIYSFDLLPESGHERPAFINLQQYYVEEYLADRLAQLPNVDVRQNNKVCGMTQDETGVTLTIETPNGAYQLRSHYVAACDGSRSTMRQLLGQESTGRVFQDRFLIADIKMNIDAPAERWFWFDPVFHPNQSVLLHRQPDNVWRIDFQLGWGADPEEEKKPEKIRARVAALLAHSTSMRGNEFELVWASVYTFACVRMKHFAHGNVFFAGDAAHGVSPFGARGANSGVQDAENLAWKIAAVVHGEAAPSLLSSYAGEREFAADENILQSTRSTDFITPKSEVSRLFRDAVLELAKIYSFARVLVNSGRLSQPATFSESVLNVPDRDAFFSAASLGAPAIDAPLKRRDGSDTWLLRELSPSFTALIVTDPGVDPPPSSSSYPQEGIGAVKFLRVALGSDHAQDADLIDSYGLLRERYDLSSGCAYLFRPDQHITARWRRPTPADLADGVACALGTTASERGHQWA